MKYRDKVFFKKVKNTVDYIISYAEDTFDSKYNVKNNKMSKLLDLWTQEGGVLGMICDFFVFFFCF